jgi:hypothetical protein
MAITSKFLRDIRESAEADLPIHASDASSGVDAVKVEETETDDEKKIEEEEDEDEKHAVSEESDEEEKAVAEEADEDEITEEEEEDHKKKAVAEEADEDELSEEEEEEKLEATCESYGDEEEVKEEDASIAKDDEEKLSEEEDEEVKEAADALTKDEELPESFKAKVSSIFEAAVKRTAKKRVAAHKKKLVESYNNKLATGKKQISETLVNKVDGYLDYVVEEWMKENRVAVEGALRSEITEKFITGLKGLFESHYIEVPAEKANVLSEQESKIKKLEKELNDELVKSVELRKENIRLKKASIIKKLTEGMTVTESAKFVELCEGVSYENANTFGHKLKAIKETYFPKTPKSSGDIDASLLTEGGLTHEDEKPKTITAADIYAQTISRMVKK